MTHAGTPGGTHRGPGGDSWLGHISTGGLEGGVQPRAGCPAAGPRCVPYTTGVLSKCRLRLSRPGLGPSCVPNWLAGCVVAAEPRPSLEG